jgi:hypothetical protein
MGARRQRHGVRFDRSQPIELSRSLLFDVRLLQPRLLPGPMMRLTTFALVALAFSATPRAAHAQTAQSRAADSSAVISTVQRLFDAMAQGDTTTLRALLVPGMRFVALATDAPAGAAPRLQTDSAFIQTLGARRQRLLERMWEPVVQIQGTIATLWTPYDFHINGERSHCGIDTATLLRTAQGWRIAALVYTVQRTGCPASPLGPPRPQE